MNIKQIEKVITMTGVFLLLFMAFVGVIAVFDGAFRLDLFDNATKQAASMLLMIVVVFIIASMLVNFMLNISRIANAIEHIADAAHRSDKGERGEDADSNSAILHVAKGP